MAFSVKKILENPGLAQKLDIQIAQGASLDKLLSLAKVEFPEATRSTINNYKKKVEEAQATGKSVTQLADKRELTGALDELESVIQDDGSITPTAQLNTPRERKVASVLEPLELMIQKGTSTLNQVQHLSPKDTMEAIKIYTAIAGPSAAGMLMSGVQELKLEYAIFEKTFKYIMLKYVPEDKHTQLLNDMENYMNQRFAELDATEEGRRVRAELEELGLR